MRYINLMGLAQVSSFCKLCQSISVAFFPHCFISTLLFFPHCFNVEVQEPECDPPCLNGGTCDVSSLPSSYSSSLANYCICPEGFTGPLCEEGISSSFVYYNCFFSFLNRTLLTDFETHIYIPNPIGLKCLYLHC